MLFFFFMHFPPILFFPCRIIARVRPFFWPARMRALLFTNKLSPALADNGCVYVLLRSNGIYTLLWAVCKPACIIFFSCGGSFVFKTCQSFQLEPRRWKLNSSIHPFQSPDKSHQKSCLPAIF